MNWAFELIRPVIAGCNTPEEAEKKVRAWCETVHPRDAVCGLIAVWFMERDWIEYQQKIKQDGATKKEA